MCAECVEKIVITSFLSQGSLWILLNSLVWKTSCLDKSFDHKNAINVWNLRLKSLQGAVDYMEGETWVPPHEEAKARSTWRKSKNLQMCLPGWWRWQLAMLSVGGKE